MKTRACLALMLMILVTTVFSAGAETLSYGQFSADSESEYLNIPVTRVNQWDKFYAFLSSFPHLRQVDMFDCPVNYTVVEEMHNRFPDVEFGLTMRFSEHKVRTDATAFSTLHVYDSQWHSSRQLSVLRYCKNMYALDIGHNNFTDLSFLYDMPQLRVLIVAIGPATDITPIASLKHLEYLELFWNRITDISCLEDLPYLMDLNLVNNLITDLTPLKKLKSLKRLWIYMYNRKKTDPVDEQTIDSLQEALPDCHIDGHSTSTAGGWRTHPHYTVLRRMFDSGVYEPFEDSPPENWPDGFAPVRE